MVLSSTIVSVMSGDYNGVSGLTVKYLVAGLLTIFAATIIVAVGSL